MVIFGRERGEALADLLKLPNGIPSHDTFSRVSQLIDSQSLQNCLSAHGKNILATLAEKQIAIDGKKFRGVSPTTRGNDGLYILNAWVSEKGLCVAQERVANKSNEISPENLSAIRKLALQILALQKDKNSIKGRQFKAALNSRYLKQIILF